MLALLDLPDDDLLLILAQISVTRHQLLKRVCKRFTSLVQSDDMLSMRRRENLVDEALVIFGGQVLPNETGNREMFALVDTKWVTLASLPGRGVTSGLRACLGSDVYMFGGYHCGNYGTHESIVRKYSFASDTWSDVTVGPFDGPYSAHEAGVCQAIDNKIIFAGGDQFNTASNNQAWLFDPSTIAAPMIDYNGDATDWPKCGFTRLPDMPYAVACAESVAFDGRLYVVGGIGNDGSWPKEGDEHGGGEDSDDDFFDEDKNVETDWIQVYSLSDRSWTLLDRNAWDVSPAKSRMENGLGKEQWSALSTELSIGEYGGGVHATKYKGGMAAVGDGANLGFVTADGAITAFPGPHLPSPFRNRMMNTELLKIMTFEMHSNSVPVLRVAKHHRFV